MYDLDADLDNLRVRPTSTTSNDLTVPSSDSQTASSSGSSFVHWLVVNVPTGSDTESGTTLLSYQVGWEINSLL